ncbi:unnamed protein product, partial [Sphacelaria rigidula]
CFLTSVDAEKFCEVTEGRKGILLVGIELWSHGRYTRDRNES